MHKQASQNEMNFHKTNNTQTQVCLIAGASKHEADCKDNALDQQCTLAARLLITNHDNPCENCGRWAGQFLSMHLRLTLAGAFPYIPPHIALSLATHDNVSRHCHSQNFVPSHKLV